MDEQRLKYCPRCKKTMPLAAFRRQSTGRLYAYCDPCARAYFQVYYQRNKAAYIKRANERLKKDANIMRNAKMQPCAACGCSYPHYVMDFDHRPGEVKCFNLADVVGQTRLSLARLKAEIAKCDVVCANCHRIRTHERRKAKLERKSKLL